MTGTAGGLALAQDVEYYNQLTAGISTMTRGLASNGAAVTLATNSMRMSYFTAVKSFNSSQGRVYSGSTAAAATPTLCRFGLYSIAANGDGTLVASVVNDTTLFAAINTAYARNWSAALDIVRGQRYAFAALVVTGVAAPVLPGQAFNNAAGTAGNLISSQNPRISGRIDGQADLPASFLVASVTDLPARAYADVLP